MDESKKSFSLLVCPTRNHPVGKEPTKSKYSEEKTCELVERLLKTLMAQQGSWVSIDKSHGEVNQKEVFNRVRETLKLMGIRYEIPDPSNTTYLLAEPVYRIKIVTDAQFLIWSQDRRRNGVFSERYGYREITWKNL